MNKVIVIVGPTGVGKTKLSIALAKAFDGEVINADSTQIYKGLDIATAKVTKEEQEDIPHHLFDLKTIDTNYTVYNYQKDCRNTIDDILKRGKTPIMVGGTGLYIQSVLFDYEFEEEPKLDQDYSLYSNAELYEQLLKIDPNTKIHLNNRKRVERAINYYHYHKQPLSSKKIANTLIYDCLIIGLTTNRDKLYEVINNRVDKMVELGLLEEALNIYNSGIRTKAVLTPIGYKELFPFFEKKESLDDCLNKIKSNSRKYAKRQYTWFKNKLNVEWFDVDFLNFNKTVREVEEYIKVNLK